MPPPALRQKRSKAPKPPRRPNGPSTRGIWRVAVAVFAAAVVVGVVAGLQDDAWNPLAELDPNAEPTLLTPLKLARVAWEPEQCRAALSAMSGTVYAGMSDREDSELCHIRTRTLLSRAGDARIAPVETRCETALRLAMWSKHAVQQAAVTHLGARVAEIGHFSSYSCRRMRTSRGTSSSMSAHATASAIDISSVRLDDGRNLSLKSGWNGSPSEQAFWREVGSAACKYFRTVLSPDYNALHADHFHFAQGRWPACR